MTAMASSVAISGVFGFSIQFVIGSVNALQIISHLPLIDVLLTENSYYMYQVILALVGFDLYDPFSRVELDFSETMPIFERFAEVGYDSCNFFTNIGSIALFQFIFIINAIIGPFFYYLGQVGVRTCRVCIRRVGMTTTTIKRGGILLVAEAYFELLLASLLSKVMESELKTYDRTGPD